MPSLSVMVGRIFRKAWLRYGKPVMWAVRPIAQWSLPAGFAYDATEDVARNALGAVIMNPESYWFGDYIYIVPVQRTADLEVLVAAGVVPSGTVDVFILTADLPTVKAAFAVQIDGEWHDVIDTGHAPVGISPGGNWAKVRLQRRS